MSEPISIEVPACTECGENPRARINGGSRPTRRDLWTLCSACRSRTYAREYRQKQERRVQISQQGIGREKLRALVARFGGYYQALRVAEWWESGRMPR